MKRSIAYIGAFLLSFCSVHAGEITPEVEKRTKELIAQLNSDDFDQRIKAVELFRELPAESMHLIETALAQATADPELSMRLTKARSYVLVKVRRQEKAKKSRVDHLWFQKAVVKTYQEQGRKDQKWDSDAINALTPFIVQWANLKIHSPANYAPINASATKAIEAGCDDAIVLFIRARSRVNTMHVDAKTFIQQHDEAAKKVVESPYHPILKALICAFGAKGFTKSENAVSADHRQSATKHLDLSLEFLGEGMRDKTVPSLLLRDTWECLILAYRKLDFDRKITIDKVFDVMHQSAPDNPLPLILKANAYIPEPYDSFSLTRIEEGWQLTMQERLAVATDLLERAWKLDPTLPDAANAMLIVEQELGRGQGQGHGRDRMELWFKRAMEADPDNYKACERKVIYLEPTWHGTEQEMIQFGRECLRNGDVEGRLPAILLDAHNRIAWRRGGTEHTKYFNDPAVWKDLKAVYDIILKALPNSIFYRSRLARHAALCGQWAIAHEQYQWLGNKVYTGGYRNVQEMESLRKAAAEWASKK